MKTMAPFPQFGFVPLTAPFLHPLQVDHSVYKTILLAFQALVLRASVEPGPQKKVMVFSVSVVKVSVERGAK